MEREFAIGGALVAGFLGASALWWALGAGPWGADAAWADIIHANPDPRPALAVAGVRQDRESGRRYSVLSLWRDPPPPAPQP
jgi:hypothetical protein